MDDNFSWIPPVLGALMLLVVSIMIDCGCFGEKDVVNLNYDTVVVYNSDTTEVLYFNTDGCTIKDSDGTLMVVIRKDEQ